MGRQRHRGQHGQDAELFAPKWIPTLNEAVDDFSFLLNRGYAENAALTLVGDRYQLRKRQRLAVLRACATDEACQKRRASKLSSEELKEQHVLLDGYNLLITTEAILGGGIILTCRDGCFRDISSVHGTYRKVEETHEALLLLGAQLNQLGVRSAHWYLDAPVSNSGRLKVLMYELAKEHGFPWEITLVNNPDQEMATQQESILITSDRWILDRATRWFNLTQVTLQAHPEAVLIDLRGPHAGKNK